LIEALATSNFFDKLSDKKKASALSETIQTLKGLANTAPGRDEIKKDKNALKIVLLLLDHVNVSVKALASLFGPFKDLQRIIKSFFRFISPEHQFYVYKELLHHKKKIMESPRSEVENLLDREEYDTQWAIWWSHWSMYSDGWWFVWELSYFADLGASRYALYQTAWDMVKISKKSLKKFYIKFGDELHERAKTATDATYPAVVQASFLIGYQKSLKFMKKTPKELNS